MALRRESIAIRDASTTADLDAVRTLFMEYVRAPGMEPGFAGYLALQDFDSELETLPGAYAPPSGRLLIAAVDAGEACGCVALKALESPGDCEMKRLYVRPEARSLGVGRKLVSRLLTEAREAGYGRMRLDTLPSMAMAQRLYRAMGFREIAPYCRNPVPGAVFMEYDLREGASERRH